MTTTPASRWADRACLTALVLVLICTPWPLGSRRLWSGLGASALILGVGGIWLLAHSLRERGALRLPSVALPGLLFIAWGLAQWIVLSVYPYGTWVEVWRYAGYLMAFYLTWALCHRDGAVKPLIVVLLALGVGVTVFALAQYATLGRILMHLYDNPFGGTSPFGPFNNRNHYVGYAIASLGPATGLAVVGSGSWRLAGLCAATVGVTGILMSLSRSGFAAMLVLLGTIAIIAYSGARIRWTMAPTRRQLLGLALFFATGAIVIGAITFLDAASPVAERLATLARPLADPSARGRVQIWTDTIPMIAARPLTGWGLNTFAWSHLRFRSTGDNSLPQHAHNEYLEITAEAGLVGAAICVWFLSLLLSQMGRRIRGAAPGFERAVRIGCLSSWVGILALSMTDFPTVIPATNFVLAVTAALGSGRWTPSDTRVA